MTPLRALLALAMVAPLALGGCDVSPPATVPRALEPFGDAPELGDAGADGATSEPQKRLADCVSGEIEIWLSAVITLRAGDETDTLERTEGRTAHVGGATIVYRGKYLSVVRPASAIEYVSLATCQVLPR